jgi:hypothetical protein
LAAKTGRYPVQKCEIFTSVVIRIAFNADPDPAFFVNGLPEFG